MLPKSDQMNSLETQNTKNNELQFEQFLVNHLPMMVNYSNYVCKDRVLAEDILQEALCRAWRYKASLLKVEVIEAWLKVIIRREFVRYVSRVQFNCTESLEHEVEDTQELEHSKRVEYMQLLTFISNLPDKYRGPLKLNIEGVGNKDIAKRLNLNQNTVVTRIFRARRMVRQHHNRFSK